MKRKISLLLALVIALLASSCGGQTGTNDQTTVGDSQTEPVETTAAGPIASYLPDTDLDGFTLRVATWQDKNGEYFTVAEADGDVVNDAIYDAVSKVRDGSWTLDKFISMTKDVYSDLDSDGTRSSGDLYGFLGYKKLYGWQSAYVSCYTEGSDGKISLGYNKEKFVDVVERMNTLLNGSEGGYITGNEPDSKIFIDGRALFHYTALETLTYDDMRASDIDYGVLPLPKYDEKQENYITPSFDCQFAIPTTAKELDKISLLIEAYSSAGYNITREAYFETALSTKYTRDDDSVEMLGIISDTLAVDLAYLNTSAGINGLGRAFMYCFSNPDAGIASYLDSIEPSEKAIIENLNEFFEG